jgi:hypothetical protein
VQAMTIVEVVNLIVAAVLLMLEVAVIIFGLTTMFRQRIHLTTTKSLAGVQAVIIGAAIFVVGLLLFCVVTPILLHFFD